MEAKCLLKGGTRQSLAMDLQCEICILTNLCSIMIPMIKENCACIWVFKDMDYSKFKFKVIPAAVTIPAAVGCVYLPTIKEKLAYRLYRR